MKQRDRRLEQAQADDPASSPRRADSLCRSPANAPAIPVKAEPTSDTRGTTARDFCSFTPPPCYDALGTFAEYCILGQIEARVCRADH
jgi:hypothetical protein